MEVVEVTVKGISPLLMHRYPLESIPNFEKKPPEVQAEISAYRVDGGSLYIPSTAFKAAFVDAARYSKGKGRASMQKPVAACVIVTPEEILLGVDSYEIDARRVVMPSTRGSVIRYRPKINPWEATFTIEFDPDLVMETQLRAIVDDSGTRSGILDFRPEKKGAFGRYMVTRWEVRETE